MLTRRLISSLAAATVLVTAGAFAAVSPEKGDWARGPAGYLMTAEDQAVWKALPDDAAADRFIELFWARRDPTPATPRNEFREDFDARVKFVDEQFSGKGFKGSMTDRGRTFIVFGQPLKALNVQADTQAGRPDESARQESNAERARQRWIYDGANAQKMFGNPHVEIEFIDRFGTGDFRLEPGRVDVGTAQQRVAAMNVVQPNLTAVPVRQPVPPPAAVAAAPKAIEGIITPALQEAVDALKSGTPKPSAALFSYAEFVAPTGDYFVPIALTVPNSANVASNGVDTFFGEIRDAAGTKVASFEEPAKPVVAKNAWFVDRTLNLPSGKYTAILGVSKGATPVLVVTAPFDTNAIGKEAVGTSKLVLWSDVLTLNEAAPVKAAYAFGKLQLVPNPSRTFGAKDELGYFIEVNNPGIDPTTSLPKLQLSVEMQRDGKPISQAPPTEVPAVSLSGTTGPGHYAIINSIPLGQLSKPLPAGDYSLKMKVFDTVSKQSYTVTESFRISG
jgi:GWxTD domain-containing protein